MTITERNKARRKMAALAWKNEVARLYQGKGTADWEGYEQQDMVRVNHRIGYVVQWLLDYPDGTEVEQPKAQFLDFVYDYTRAHSGVNRNKKFGYYDIQNNLVKFVSSLSEITLSDPQYKGVKSEQYCKQQRAKRYNDFGLHSASNRKNTPNKAKFGLN